MCQSLEKDDYRIGNVMLDSPEELISSLNAKLDLPLIRETFCADSKSVCNACEYRYLCGGKCPTSGDDGDYECTLVKALLNYSLFYFDPESSMKENIDKYIEYFEEVIKNLIRN